MRGRKLSGRLGALLCCAALGVPGARAGGVRGGRVRWGAGGARLCGGAWGLTVLQTGSVALGQRRGVREGGVERQQDILGTVVGVGGRFGGGAASVGALRE